MAKFMLSILALAMLAGSGCATSPLADGGAVKREIRGSLQEILGKGGTSASYAVIRNGRVVLADAVGHLDAVSRAPATVDTLYNIGSLSKVYTAVAVMKLVDEGKVGLDEPVVKYLPEFRLKDPRYVGITVRMLLDHSSGMLGTDYTTGITYKFDERYYEKLDAYFRKSVLKADPGKFSVYCNDGFEVAEMLVAKVAGMPFDRYVKRNIFEPLGLSSAGFANRTFPPESFAVMGSSPQEFPNVMGSGGVSTTVVELARFGELFLRDGANVLSPPSVREMDRRQGKTFIAEDTGSVRFGLGWDSVGSAFGDVLLGPEVLEKSGGTSQFISHLYVIPKYNMVAAMSVSMDFKPDVPVYLREIVAKVLKAQGIDVAAPVPVPYPPLQPQPLPSAFEKEYAGYYSSNGALVKVAVIGDRISLTRREGEKFVPEGETLGFDGDVFARANGEKMYRFVQAEGRRYLMTFVPGKGIVGAMGQKLTSVQGSVGAWQGRLNRLYLPAEVALDAVYVMPGLRLVRQEGLDGLLFMQEGSSMTALKILDDLTTGLVLQIPGANGRDLSTLTVEKVAGEEWLAKEAYSLRPVSALAELGSDTVTIPSDGANRLYRIPVQPPDISLPKKGRIIAYDLSGRVAYDSIAKGSVLSKLPKSGFIRFLGVPGAEFNIRR
jgi:CubicO group peptidase (beta-lactamase class C family)